MSQGFKFSICIIFYETLTILLYFKRRLSLKCFSYSLCTNVVNDDYHISIEFKLFMNHVYILRAKIINESYGILWLKGWRMLAFLPPWSTTICPGSIIRSPVDCDELRSTISSMFLPFLINAKRGRIFEELLKYYLF